MTDALSSGRAQDEQDVRGDRALSEAAPSADGRSQLWEAIHRYKDGAEFPGRVDDAIDALIAGDAKDAARYRWLVANPFSYSYEAPDMWFVKEHGPHPTLADGIDAAMASGENSNA